LADAPGAEVSLYVLHLALDHLLVSVVRGSMQHVSVATVHRHVGYWVVRTILLEEDQVTTLEVVPGYPLAVLVPILFCRIVWQLLAELLVDKPCKAGAVFLLVSPAGIGWRVVIGGADVRPTVPYYVPALNSGVRGAVKILAGTRAAFGWRKVLGWRGGSSPDERDSVGDDLARAAPWGDAHDVAIASLHLVGAEFDPHAPVAGLVRLYPLRAPGSLHAESRSRAVALPDWPPGVEGVVAACGSLQLEARIAGGGARRDVFASMSPNVTPSPIPPRRFEAPGVRAVHDLRVVGQGFLLRYISLGRTPLGRIRPRDRALRDQRLRCATRGLCPSRERCDGDEECSQNSHRCDQTESTHGGPPPLFVLTFAPLYRRRDGKALVWQRFFQNL